MPSWCLQMVRCPYSLIPVKEALRFNIEMQCRMQNVATSTENVCEASDYKREPNRNQSHQGNMEPQEQVTNCCKCYGCLGRTFVNLVLLRNGMLLRSELLSLVVCAQLAIVCRCGEEFRRGSSRHRKNEPSPFFMNYWYQYVEYIST